MVISIIKYMKGYVRIRLKGYSPERFMNLCSHHNILLWDIVNVGDYYEMCISLNGFRQLKPILKKTKTRMVIQERHGFPFFLHRYRKRKMFFGGIVFCALLLYVMSLFIWDIHIYGNYTQTTDVILDFLDTKKIFHGIQKKDLDCEKIESMLRSQYNDIIWASAEIKGTRLIINVKENTDTTVTRAESTEPSDLIAEQDCIVTQIVTRNGSPKVSVGSIVKKGDVFVSGRMDILNDSGEIVNYQYCAADADIYVKTMEDYKNELSRKYIVKNYTGERKKYHFIKILNKKFNIFKRKNTFMESDQLVEETQWKLGESFYLPLYTGICEIKEFTSEEKIYTEKEAEDLLNSNIQRFCEKLVEKGVQIVENRVKITIDEKSCIAEGQFQVIKKAGERIPTEIISIPEEGIQQDEY